MNSSMRRAIFPWFALCMLLANGCRDKANSSLPTAQIEIGAERFTVEIATSDTEKQTGLMHRESLDLDHGMIFPFSDESLRTFWNHDVHFPLDVLFLDSAGTIVSVVRLDPYSEKNVSSQEPARYAIELNAGTAEHLHVGPGTRLVIPKQVVEATAR